MSAPCRGAVATLSCQTGCAGTRADLERFVDATVVRVAELADMIDCAGATIEAELVDLDGLLSRPILNAPQGGGAANELAFTGRADERPC